VLKKMFLQTKIDVEEEGVSSVVAAIFVAL
jgi:hypothetical protein